MNRIVLVGLIGLACVGLCQTKKAASKADPTAMPEPGIVNGLPYLHAESALVYDPKNKRVLFAKNPDSPHFPASTTKIMTALLLLEHCKPEDVVTAPDGLDKIEESSMHLKPGEQITVKTLLYALMLRSANDGCVAAANHVARDLSKFIAMMNQRAKELGCKDTNFVTPNGLHDPMHHTTAHDLALIAAEAMKHPLFREIVATKKIEIQRSINQADRWMVNRNKLLFKDPTANGIKTGYTKDAGNTYVGSVNRDGLDLYTVLLKSDHKWQGDHRTLLEWVDKNFSSRVMAKEGESIGVAKVSGGVTETVPLVAAEKVQIFLRANIPARFEVDQTPVSAPIRAGTPVGKVVIRQGDATYEVPTVAGATVAAKPLATGSVLGLLALGAGLVAATAAVLHLRR